MTSASIDLSTCTAEWTVMPNGGCRALRNLEITVTAPGHGEIATVKSIQIIRWLLRGVFHQVLDDESQELHQFSQKLFDKNGFLKDEHIEHDFHKGTGCWGDEVNKGTIHYIVEICVEEPFRRAGVGSWVLNQFISSSYVGSEDFLFAFPASLDHNTRAQFTQNKGRSIAFFRKNHFRRVGKTSYFAFSPNLNHPSRIIPVEQDAEGTDIFYRDGQELHIRTAERDSLHHAIIASSSTSATLQFGLSPEQVAMINPIEVAVGKAYERDPSLIHSRNENGMTPLHQAAALYNVRTIRALLDLSLGSNNASSGLSRRDNTNGDTPLEACGRSMLESKEFREAMLGGIDRWTGYPEEALQCAYELRKAMGEDVGLAAEYIRTRKWGCTCGQCSGTWLSKRMCRRLHREAEMSFDMFRGEVPDYDSRGGFKAHIYDALRTLPLNVQRRMTRATWMPYLVLYPAIAHLLETGTVPTSEAVLALVGPLTKPFIDIGGKVEYVLDLIIDIAESESILHDENFDESMEELYKEGDKTGVEYHNMPKCANDLEFDLVRKKLNAPKMSRILMDDEGLSESLDNDDEEDMDEDGENIDSDEDREDTDEDGAYSLY